jgi:hypothetical protein
MNNQIPCTCDALTVGGKAMPHYHKGTDLVAPDSNTTTDAANPPSLPPNEQPDELDIANEVALIMRATRPHIIDGTFMPGGLTPHQYTTKMIEVLITSQQVRMLDRLKEQAEDFTDYHNDESDEWTTMVEAVPVSAIEQLRKELQ